MTFIIERNIPIPEANRGAGKKGEWSSLASTMGVGDSVLLKDKFEARSLYQALRNAKRGGSQRQVMHTEGDKTWQAYRVWRTK